MRYPVKIALINGEEDRYDICSFYRWDYRRVKKVYLGKGIIYSIDGKKVDFPEKRHFWRELDR